MYEEDTLEYKGYMIVISTDDDPINPREYDDDIVTIHVAHTRYNFGDENYNDRESIEEARQEAKRNGDLTLPLYMYDHSGITISLSPFSCPWDSGQVGFVQVSRKAMIENWGKVNFTPKLKEKAKEVAKNVVQELDDYLTGNVHRFDVCPIDEDGEYDTIDSIEGCGNFIGDIKYCIDDAKGNIDWIVKDKMKKHCEQVKTWIKHKVPLEKRTTIKLN